MNLYYLGSALNLSAIYMIAGCGAAISLKSGELNLGGEGQIYAGGFFAAILLTKFSTIPVIISLPFALIISFVISGLLTLFSTFLKRFKNADFLFTSFIISSAIIPLINGLIAGPFRNKSANLLATPFITQAQRLPQIMKPSPLNISFFTAIISCLVFFYIIYHTAYGRKLCIFGTSPKFAQYAGYNEKKITYSSAFISGGMHGLCGALTIAGTYYACHSGFYSGLGWNSFSSALIAGANPVLMIPSSLIMGFLTTYTNKFALYHNFGFDASGLLQAIILLLISGRVKNAS